METVVRKVRQLKVTVRAREWCRLCYPNHPRGCPNYGIKKGCPPSYPMIEKVFDLARPIYIVAIKFDLAAQIAKIRNLHPGWTNKQCRNLRYWQGTVRARLKSEVARVLAQGRFGDRAEFSPEAAGVNTNLTCLHSGIKLEWPPRQYVYMVALVGFNKKGASQ